MLLLIFIMVVGIVLGHFLRKKSVVIRANNILTTLAIYLLLFVLGVGVGSDKNIITNLPSLGWDAFILTVGAVFGSILCVRFVEKRFFP
ncbi:lysine exporter LysO family protein [Halosquirtibacter laminarini]|uniref:Lysine exporter LysO family protein n=1 Tax=Halosquirtibacter laminarini TaxID=3374600 RepID=A0AC61NIT1_9BACT|nr:lysine exporter LysO family protein [Prolixibacteraceae bacterium]